MLTVASSESMSPSSPPEASRALQSQVPEHAPQLTATLTAPLSTVTLVVSPVKLTSEMGPPVPTVPTSSGLEKEILSVNTLWRNYKIYILGLRDQDTVFADTRDGVTVVEQFVSTMSLNERMLYLPGVGDAGDRSVGGGCLDFNSSTVHATRYSYYETQQYEEVNNTNLLVTVLPVIVTSETLLSELIEPMLMPASINVMLDSM